jgi:hypothetical protein
MKDDNHKELSREKLEEMLEKCRQELEELDCEWRMYFGMSGVHLNPGDAERLRSSLDRDKKRVREKMEKIASALEAL